MQVGYDETKRDVIIRFKSRTPEKPVNISKDIETRVHTRLISAIMAS